jgi:endonuclease/exonuclease/phosphatase family metal-dependent hydrolase
MGFGERPGVPVRLASSPSLPRGDFPSSFTVATYNVNHGGGDLGAVVGKLAREDPDFALLQEVDRHLPRSGWRDQVRYLARGLEREAHFLPTLRRGAGSYGLVFLGRRGWMGEPRALRLPGEGEPRFALLVEMDTPWGRLLLGNVHLSVDREERARQVFLLSRYLPAGGPVILGGDWNAPSEAREMEPLRRLLPGVAFEGGDGFLYRGMELLDLRVFPGEPSDHPLLFARFAFPLTRL